MPEQDPRKKKKKERGNTVLSWALDLWNMATDPFYSYNDAIRGDGSGAEQQKRNPQKPTNQKEPAQNIELQNFNTAPVTNPTRQTTQPTREPETEPKNVNKFSAYLKWGIATSIILAYGAPIIAVYAAQKLFYSARKDYRGDKPVKYERKQLNVFQRVGSAVRGVVGAYISGYCLAVSVIPGIIRGAFSRDGFKEGFIKEIKGPMASFTSSWQRVAASVTGVSHLSTDEQVENRLKGMRNLQENVRLDVPTQQKTPEQKKSNEPVQKSVQPVSAKTAQNNIEMTTLPKTKHPVQKALEQKGTDGK